MSFTSQFNEATGRWWRKKIMDECPDACLERIRRKRIEDIKMNNSLREAVRLWEIEYRKSQVREIEHA